LSDDISHLRDLCIKKEEKRIQEYLDGKSDEYLLELFANIIDSSPFLYELAITIIVDKLYSDDDRFVRILCKLIENTGSDWAFEEIALRRREKTLAIAKRMIDLGTRPGLCSGIIISPLLGQGILDKETTFRLESDNPILQLHSLVGIRNLLIKGSKKATKPFILKLREVAKNIDPGNTDVLIQCLVRASCVDKDAVLSVLEREIEQRGYIAAATYIRSTQYQKDFSVSLLKKALQIIEAESPEDTLIDDSLVRIYEEDQSYVVERLRERLREGSRIKLVGDMLGYKIMEVGSSSVIKMLEEEIDNKNPIMVHIGESILEDFFPSDKEWLEWCKKWKDDKKKETVVLRALARILTGLINYEPSTVRDDAIILVKEFALRDRLDYDEVTKAVNLGKDSHEGTEHKEATIKALQVIEQILHPPVQIDARVLERNIKNYPYLSKAIDANWLIESAKSKSPHFLAYVYDEELDYDKMKELAKEFELEKDEKKRQLIAWRYDSLARAVRTQWYWEHVFRTLDEYSLKMPLSKLHNSDIAESILAEAEVLARLVPHFRVELEPDIEVFRPKKLDAKIEFNGQQALIEVAVVKERIELEVAHGGISLPGGKAKSVLLTKFKEQLKEGKVDPKTPVIIVLQRALIDSYEVENAIYGQLQFHWKTRTDKKQIVEEGVTRSQNSFYEEDNSDIVTIIASYKRDLARKDPLVGRLYRPPPQIVPRNPLSREFRLKLRNALFGESEDSSWQSLLKIEGIDEDLAKKLHANGIEDLEILAVATDKELQVEGFDAIQLQKFQKEAIRIIRALLTGSIRFLKGIDETVFDLLAKKGIYLITQIIKLTEIPEDISPSTWTTMIDDAKRITSSE